MSVTTPSLMIPVLKSLVVLCDACHRALNLGESPEALPNPWRRVGILGWVGSFHACSDECETEIRARYVRPEKETS